MRRRLLLRALSAGVLGRSSSAVALLMAALLAWPLASAAAQDDWEITREPQRPRRPRARPAGRS